MKNKEEILNYIDELDKKISDDMKNNKKVIEFLDNLYSQNIDIVKHNELLNDPNVINFLQISDLKIHFDEQLKNNDIGSRK